MDSLFVEFRRTPVFEKGGVGTKRLLDAKMVKPLVKRIYPEVMRFGLYKDMLRFPDTFAYYEEYCSLNYTQSVKRLAMTLCKGEHANEWEVIGFANNATICTLAAAYWCLAHAFPYFHGAEDDELNSSIILIPKISQTSFIISFGYAAEGMENLLYKYARTGAKSAIADLRRFGIVATYKESQGFSLFDINLVKSFGEQKEFAISEAEYRLNPPKGDFNFDDPLAGLPFEDE